MPAVVHTEGTGGESRKGWVQRAEGQESQEGCDVDRVEGDAQLNLAMHLGELSLNAPLTLCWGVKNRTFWRPSIGTCSVNSAHALRSLCSSPFRIPSSSLAVKGTVFLQSLIGFSTPSQQSPIRSLSPVDLSFLISKMKRIPCSFPGQFYDSRVKCLMIGHLCSA